ncbi:lactose permease [Colletotrichum incanum]|nr:lactose permease [Colletotrichum incanum]
MGRREGNSALKQVDDAETRANTYAAIMATHKPDPRGPGYMKLYLLAGVCFFCSTMNGYDSALLGSINALPNYTKYFGLPANDNASTGIVFAIFQVGYVHGASKLPGLNAEMQVGQMCGALFVWMADWYGRTWHIFFGCLAIVPAFSTSLPIFIGGRFILSFFATCAHTLAPLYLVELAPATYRGTIAGLYNTFYHVVSGILPGSLELRSKGCNMVDVLGLMLMFPIQGSILATSAVYACHRYLSDEGDLDWRIPLWLQMVCPGIVCSFIKSFPESPRWLVAQDRHDEAKDIIATFHTNGDLNHPLVELQMKEMITSVDPAHVPSWKDHFDLRVLIESRSSRYRLMLNVAFSWFGQFSGNNIISSTISYYLPILLSGVGINNTNTQLALNIIYSVVGWVFSTASSRLHDVIGRRKMLITTTSGMTVCLAIVAGCAAGYTDSGNTTASIVSIVFIFVFGAVFATGFTPMQPIYPAEVVSNKMRAKAMGTFELTAGAAGFLNTFVGPIALSSIGYWFYVFFVAWDSFEIFFMYFFFVETKGFTLKELDEVFEAKNPRKASVQAKKRERQIMREGVY